LVLASGSAIAANFAEKHASAVLEAWYGGEEGGTAIAQTLSGSNNPSGRLPITFYRSASDLPAFDDYSMRGRTYRYFTAKTLVPFGYGLSYAKFRYFDIVAKSSPESSSGLNVSVKVENVSKVEGDEVVQLYVSRESAVSNDPVRELRGFQRVHLAPDTSRVVEFHLDVASIPTRQPQQKLRISIGGGQPLEGISHAETVF